MILCDLGQLYTGPYDEGRDLEQGLIRGHRASSVTVRADQRPAQENQEGLRP